MCVYVLTAWLREQTKQLARLGDVRRLLTSLWANICWLPFKSRSFFSLSITGAIGTEKILGRLLTVGEENYFEDILH
jgi:hypothetical protein